MELAGEYCTTLGTLQIERSTEKARDGMLAQPAHSTDSPQHVAHDITRHTSKAMSIDTGQRHLMEQRRVLQTSDLLLQMLPHPQLSNCNASHHRHNKARTRSMSCNEKTHLLTNIASSDGSLVW